MNSFVLDLIDRCIEEDDEDKLEEAIKYKESKYDYLTQAQFDLMTYGGFSYSDVEKLKVVERNRFLDIISKRLEAMSKK